MRLRELGLDTIDFKLVKSKKRLLPRVIVGDPGKPRVLDSAGEHGSAVLHTTPSEMAYVRPRPCSAAAVTAIFPPGVAHLPALRFFRHCVCACSAKTTPGRWVKIFPAPFQQLGDDDKARLAEKLKNPTWLRAETPKKIALAPFHVNLPVQPQRSAEAFVGGHARQVRPRCSAQGAIQGDRAQHDLGRLPEFDTRCSSARLPALGVLRSPSRSAASLDIPVIDDPESIARCSNKVYLHEALLADIPTPRTPVVSRRTPIETIMELGPPTIVKLPQVRSRLP
ncbi:MAG: hypothetical protein R2724_08275 [Bryobacterales bacterium]